MYNFIKSLSLILTVAMLSSLLVGCVTEPPAATEPPTEPPVTEIPNVVGLHYTLTEKTVDGIDITARFLQNLLTLSEDGKAVWIEITSGGTEVSEGTYAVSDNVLSVRIGLKTYEFTMDETKSTLQFSGKIDRKNVTMQYVKNDNFAFSDDKGEVVFTDELFGDDINENFYNYCPSVMIEGRTMHIWYCSNEKSGNVTDYVAYRKGTLHDDGKWTFSEKKLVLGPGEKGAWDCRHVCDPSVVKGEFHYNGTVYNYLMAYLGCLTSDVTKNEVGIALAQSPEGPWIKPENINPIADFFSDYNLSRTESNSGNPANTAWGYGQPSLVSVDKQGQIILFYSAGTTTGTYTVAELWDLSNVNAPVEKHSLMVSNKGITNSGGGSDVINNADFAYDPQTGRLYCIKEDFPYPTDNDINWIAGSNSIFYVEIGKDNALSTRIFEDYNYTWTMAGKIDAGATGYKRNHNCAIVTDEYGWITDSLRLSFVYTMSMLPGDYPDWSTGGQWPALHTYRLHGYMLDVR